MAKTNHTKKLDTVMAAVNKNYGVGTLMRASDVKWAHFKRIPSGVFSLDVGIGGGIPRGRVIQILGHDSDGKTTLSLLIAAQAQHLCMECMTHLGWYTHEERDEETDEVVSREMIVTSDCECGQNRPHVVMYFDSEGTLDPVWATLLGVDVPALYYIAPEHAEKGIDIANAAIRTGELGLVVVDSVANFTPGTEVEKSADDQQPGVQAKLMNRFMRTVQSGLNSIGLMNDKKPAIVLVNQFREKIGVMWGDPRTWPGGKGQDYAASIRIFLRAGEYLNEKGEAVKQRPKETFGRVIHWDNKKNKTATPESKGTFKLFNRDLPELGFAKGTVNNLEMIVEHAVFLGHIEQKGSWFDLSPVLGEEAPEKALQGMNKVMEFLYANPELSEVIRSKIINEVKGAAA